MLNIFYKFISNFVFPKSKRKAFKEKYVKRYAVIKADMENNNINIPYNRNIKIVVIGKNNTIEIDKDLNIESKITISLVGSNNVIKIGKAHAIISLIMGINDNREIHNSKFVFGNSSSGHVTYMMLENNTTIKIGDDCMFSTNIELRCTDDHTVLDDHDNIVNLAESIEIGNHVWLCKDVMILKNTTIPDGCIVGAKSVVAGKKFTKPNCVICGNPAKVVRGGYVGILNDLTYINKIKVDLISSLFGYN